MRKRWASTLVPQSLDPLGGPGDALAINPRTTARLRAYLERRRWRIQILSPRPGGCKRRSKNPSRLKRLLRLQRQLATYKLLIIDELGYVPLSATGAELLFEVFSQRYERGHRQPHRGSAALFFDPGNLDSLCQPHHNATKQRLERGRRQVRIGVDGWPVGT